MKATRLLLVCGVVLLGAVFFVGIYVIPRVQSGSPRTARQTDAARVPLSDLYVDVTYATPEFVRRVKLEPFLRRYQGRTQPFLVGLNTHVGSLEHLRLEGRVELEDDQGERYPALGAPVVVSEHHNLYLVAFPLLDNHGQPIFGPTRDQVRLIFTHVGATAQRVFTWKLPVIEPVPARTLANTLMLGLGVVGALMVILSPCALELTTYYTGIIAGVVSSAALAERTSRWPASVRRRILANLGGFVGGFTLLYVLSGATVAALGHSLINGEGTLRPLIDAICGPNPNGPVPARLQQVINGSAARASATAPPPAPHEHAGRLGRWGRYANWLGAAFLAFFALKALGWAPRSNICMVWLGRWGRGLRGALAWVVAWVSPARAEVIRRPCVSLRQPANLTPLNSFCAGLGLSVSCLTCMGGAILYPLLIFVGTSKWYWGAMILGTYSLALAVPMAAIAVAVGDFAWKYARHTWLLRGLQWTSAVIMLAVAVLVAFEHTRFINTVVFSLLSTLGGQGLPAVAWL